MLEAWQIDEMRRQERARKIAREETRRMRVEIRECCRECHGAGCDACNGRGSRAVER